MVSDMIRRGDAPPAGTKVTERDKLECYRYKASIEFPGLTLDEELLKRIWIKNIIIENLFLDNFFPVLQLSLTAPMTIYDEIQKNRQKYLVKLILKQSKIDMANDKTLTVSQSGKLEYDEILNILFQDFTPVQTEGSMRYKVDQDRKDEILFDFDLYLFALDHVKLNKKFVNFIIQDPPKGVLDAIGVIVNEVGITDMVMTPLDNKNEEKHEQIIVPPLNLRNSIEYLQQVYGLYTTGVRQFYDFKTYYLLSNHIKTIPVRKKEYPTVYVNIAKSDIAESFKEGCYVDDKKKCYVITIPNLLKYNKGDIVATEFGNVYNVMTFDKMFTNINYDGVQFRQKDSQAKLSPKTAQLKKHEKSGETKAFVYEKTNAYTTDEIIHRTEESKTVLAARFVNLNMDILTPNKVYIFLFEDENMANDLNGKYKLQKVIYNISMHKQAIDLILEAVAEFRLIDKDVSQEKSNLDSIMGDSIINSVGGSTDVMGGVVSDISGSLREELSPINELISTAQDSANNVLSDISSKLDNVINTEGLINGIEKFKEISDVVTNTIKEVQTNIINEFKSIVDSVKSKVQEVIKSVTDKLKEKITEIQSAVASVKEKVQAEITAKITQVKNTIKQITDNITKIEKTVMTNIQNLTKTLTDNVSNMANNIQFLSEIETIPSQITSSFTNENLIDLSSFTNLTSVLEGFDINNIGSIESLLSLTETTQTPLPDITELADNTTIELADFKQVLIMKELPDYQDLIAAIELPDIQSIIANNGVEPTAQITSSNLLDNISGALGDISNFNIESTVDTMISNFEKELLSSIDIDQFTKQFENVSGVFDEISSIGNLF